MEGRNELYLLGLPTRITNRLIEGQVASIKELINMDPIQILKFPGISVSSLKQIEKALNIYKEKNSTPNMQKHEFESMMLKNIYKGLTKFYDQETIYILLKHIFKDALMEIKQEIQAAAFNDLNDLRTVVLEQSRILEGMQSMNRPDGVISKISEKIPGFSSMIYQLHKEINKV